MQKIRRLLMVPVFVLALTACSQEGEEAGLELDPESDDAENERQVEEVEGLQEDQEEED